MYVCEPGGLVVELVSTFKQQESEETPFMLALTTQFLHQRAFVDVLSCIGIFS